MGAGCSTSAWLPAEVDEFGISLGKSAKSTMTKPPLIVTPLTIPAVAAVNEEARPAAYWRRHDSKLKQRRLHNTPTDLGSGVLHGHERAVGVAAQPARSRASSSRLHRERPARRTPNRPERLPYG